MGLGIALSLTCMILLIAVNSILAAERREMEALETDRMGAHNES
ncbi:hypothetical protein [Corynebacterium striatum]